MRNIVVFILTFVMLVVSSTCLASDKVPLVYNIMPSIQNESAIDSETTSKIEFSLYDEETMLWVNGAPVEIVDNKFYIDVSNIKGKVTFEFTNDVEESAKFTYFISDGDGYLDEFKLDEVSDKDYKTYIDTVRNIEIIYTEKDKKSLKNIQKTLESVPEEITLNVNEIKLVPAKHASGASGITKDDKVVIYNASKFGTKTLKNIILHEVAHTWSNKLIEDKKIDYSFTEYAKLLEGIKKFPSNYAKQNVLKGNYSEDFAESVAFYYINTKSFAKKFPIRTQYIEKLVQNE